MTSDLDPLGGRRSVPPPGRLTVTISADAWRAVCDHVHRCTPREAVGYLAGPSPGDATRALPLRNVAPEARGYRADPWSQFLAERQMGEEGLAAVAVYHSHPDGTPTLSPTDRRHAPPGQPQVVVATAGDRCTAAAWVVDDDGEAQPLDLRVC